MDSAPAAVIDDCPGFWYLFEMAYHFQFPRSTPGRLVLLTLLCLIACVAQAATVFAVEKLTVYSGRSERLIKPVLDEFTSKTGIQVDLLSSGTTELVNRLKAEGDRTPADLFLTNDAGSLEQARAAGILRPLNMREVDRAIPVQRGLVPVRQVQRVV